MVVSKLLPEIPRRQNFLTLQLEPGSGYRSSGYPRGCYFRPSGQVRSSLDRWSRYFKRSKIFITIQPTKTMGATLKRIKDISPKVSENTTPMTKRTMATTKMLMRPTRKSVGSVPTLLPSNLRDLVSGPKGSCQVFWLPLTITFTSLERFTT